MNREQQEQRERHEQGEKRPYKPSRVSRLRIYKIYKGHSLSDEEVKVTPAGSTGPSPSSPFRLFKS